jgi:hypothetical protein
MHRLSSGCGVTRRYFSTIRDAWVWIAFAPVWRLVLAFVIGKRDQAGADLRLARVAHVTDDSMPLFTSDQLPAYRHALLNTYGAWYHPQRQGSRGAYPKPRRRPPPSLRYAQVIKRREGGRIVQVSTRVVFGTPEAVAASLAHKIPCGGTACFSWQGKARVGQRPMPRWRGTPIPPGAEGDIFPL